MAAPLVRAARGLVYGRLLSTTVALCRRAPPLGPMPNEQFEGKNLESLKKYRVFTRYNRVAEAERKKPVWWKSYSQLQNDALSKKVDIGLPYLPLCRTELKHFRKELLKKNHNNAELERASRHRTLQLSLHEVRAEWQQTSGPHHIQRVAEHYGLYKDLFGEATFVPRIPLDITYNIGDEAVMPVYYGNVVTPSEAALAPDVIFEAQEDSLWTLLLTNPDGHLEDTESEYLHWLVGNIPGNQLLLGDEICHYFPPFPAKGTGYHRHIFLLFKQDEHIDFTEDIRPTPCHSLKMRTFKTLDFYKKYENKMTPGGLAFFQCKWDDNVTQVYHHLLNMKEPVFEHQFPPVYHPPQKKFPHGQPLRYLDRYRESDEPTYGIY